MIYFVDTFDRCVSGTNRSSGDRDVSKILLFPFKNTTVWGPVSGHKRRKHVFRTSEALQSAEINTESSFSIQEAGVKLTAAEHIFSLSYIENYGSLYGSCFRPVGPTFT